MRIDVDGVHVTLAGTDVLTAVDATVESGHLVGLVGPNGAGKTTLLRAITAALDPAAGSVFVGDADVHALTAREASRRLASVPQQTNLDFEFTVREVVEMGRHPHRNRFGGGVDGTGDDVVEAALERAQIASLADRVVTSLSGGERQRVLLARALAQDAPVLVLDEPTASLDVHHQVRTLGLVRDLVDDGRTGIAAIHDLDLAARFCDSLLLVADGRVHASGPPADVLTTDRIREAFGADAVVTRNPVTGTPTVTVRSGTERTQATEPVDDGAHTDLPAIDARVHVVGGTSHAAPFLPALATAATGLTVGPVVEGSQDESVAAGLDVPLWTTPPHATPPESVVDAVCTAIDRADAVVVPAALPDASVERFRPAATNLVEPGPETTPADLVAAIASALDRPLPPEEVPAD